MTEKKNYEDDNNQLVQEGQQLVGKNMEDKILSFHNIIDKNKEDFSTIENIIENVLNIERQRSPKRKVVNKKFNPRKKVSSEEKSKESDSEESEELEFTPKTQNKSHVPVAELKKKLKSVSPDAINASGIADFLDKLEDSDYKNLKSQVFANTNFEELRSIHDEIEKYSSSVRPSSLHTHRTDEQFKEEMERLYNEERTINEKIQKSQWNRKRVAEHYENYDKFKSLDEWLKYDNKEIKSTKEENEQTKRYSGLNLKLYKNRQWNCAPNIRTNELLNNIFNRYQVLNTGITSQNPEQEYTGMFNPIKQVVQAVQVYFLYIKPVRKTSKIRSTEIKIIEKLDDIGIQPLVSESQKAIFVLHTAQEWMNVSNKSLSKFQLLQRRINGNTMEELLMEKISSVIKKDKWFQKEWKIIGAYLLSTANLTFGNVTNHPIFQHTMEIYKIFENNYNNYFKKLVDTHWENSFTLLQGGGEDISTVFRETVMLGLKACIFNTISSALAAMYSEDTAPCDGEEEATVSEVKRFAIQCKPSFSWPQE